MTVPLVSIAGPTTFYRGRRGLPESCWEAEMGDCEKPRRVVGGWPRVSFDARVARKRRCGRIYHLYFMSHDGNEALILNRFLHIMPLWARMANPRCLNQICFLRREGRMPEKGHRTKICMSILAPLSTLEVKDMKRRTCFKYKRRIQCTNKLPPMQNLEKIRTVNLGSLSQRSTKDLPLNIQSLGKQMSFSSQMNSIWNMYQANALWLSFIPYVDQF